MIHLGREQLLQEGEVVNERVRKHWIVYVVTSFIHVFGCLFFLIGVYVLHNKGLFGSVSQEAAYGSMVLLMFVIIFWISFFYAWTKDYFDMWYITNQHIIAINQKDILTREEAFMELGKIQDVSFEKDGFISTLFGYGRLKVQSAGIEQEFIMEDVHDVEEVAHTIMEIRDKIQGTDVPPVVKTP